MQPRSRLACLLYKSTASEFESNGRTKRDVFSKCPTVCSSLDIEAVEGRFLRAERILRMEDEGEDGKRLKAIVMSRL